MRARAATDGHRAMIHLPLVTVCPRQMQHRARAALDLAASEFGRGLVFVLVVWWLYLPRGLSGINARLRKSYLLTGTMPGGRGNGVVPYRDSPRCFLQSREIVRAVYRY